MGGGRAGHGGAAAVNRVRDRDRLARGPRSAGSGPGRSAGPFPVSSAVDAQDRPDPDPDHRHPRPHHRLRPGPHVPDARRRTPAARDEARARPAGRPPGRVPGAAGRRQDPAARGPRGHPDDHREPGQLDRRVGAGDHDPGQRPDRRRAAGRVGSERRSAASSARPAASTSSRSARPRRTRATSIDPKQFPPLFSGEQLVSRRRSAHERQTNGRVVNFVLKDERREAVRATTPPRHIGEYFAIVLDGKVISAPVDQLGDPRRQRPDLAGRHDRRLSAQGGHGARHGPPVRLAAVPDRGALERHDQRHARRAVPHPEPAGRRDRDPPRHRLHAHLLPTAGRDRELRAHLLHARRPGDLPAHARDPDPRRDRRLRPLDRHGGRRQHPDLRADEGGDAASASRCRRRSRPASAGPGTRSSTRTCRA